MAKEFICKCIAISKPISATPVRQLGLRRREELRQVPREALITAKGAESQSRAPVPPRTLWSLLCQPYLCLLD